MRGLAKTMGVTGITKDDLRWLLLSPFTTLSNAQSKGVFENVAVLNDNDKKEAFSLEDELKSIVKIVRDAPSELCENSLKGLQCGWVTDVYSLNVVARAFPAHFSGFNSLTFCELFEVQLTDKSLEQLLSHSPLLKELCLDCCQGLCNPTISAANLLSLTADFEMAGELLTLNCPKLREISLLNTKNLRIDRIPLHEFSPALESARVLDNGDLKELYLCCGEGQGSNAKFSEIRFVDVVGSFKSLKTLSLNIKRDFESETDQVFPLPSLLEELQDLEVLFLNGKIFQGLTRDLMPPFLNVPHANLHKIVVPIYEFGEKAISLLGCILRSTPALEEMTEMKYIFDLSELIQYHPFLRRRANLSNASQCNVGEGAAVIGQVYPQ
eukprot:Gb_05641 [translate_table: standard]